MPHILTELSGPIGTITLDNERRRNVLSQPVVEEIIAALRAFSDAKVRVAILRARPGAKVFSAGHDVGELPESRRDPLGWDDPLRQLVREIENFPGPVVAMVEGSVWGGATETVFCCDVIIATETATFAVTPAKLGVPYNVGGMLTFLNATGLRIAKEMIFTARPMDAIRAERLGIINYVVPAPDLDAFTLRIAREIAENAPLSIAVMKEQLRILAGAHTMSPQGFERVRRGCAAWSTTATTIARGSVPSRRSEARCSGASEPIAPRQFVWAKSCATSASIAVAAALSASPPATSPRSCRARPRA
jgi:methylmalonyl-CoA decarboxylase